MPLDHDPPACNWVNDDADVDVDVAVDASAPQANDREESKHEREHEHKHDKSEDGPENYQVNYDDNYDDDDEDSLLDEMLQKAELLRLAMLAASSFTTQPNEGSPHPPGTVAAAIPSTHLIKNTIRPSIDWGPNEDQTPRPMPRPIPRPTPTSTAIPETIETADNVTECSSVGYYSIVYGSASVSASTNPINAGKAKAQTKTPANRTKKTRQWLRDQSQSKFRNGCSKYLPQMQGDDQVLEEEKTNHDGSIHQAFSDDGTSCPSRRRRLQSHSIPPIATSWSMSSNNEILSPLAISPPNDDEIVSVADYLKTNTDQSNGNPGENLMWVKVDFVNQSDEDYVPLQDYSRTILNELTLKPSSPEIAFRRRKRSRKILSFGLCCVVLGFLWLQLRISNKSHANSNANSNATALEIPKAISEPVVVGVVVVVEKDNPFVAHNQLALSNTPQTNPKGNSKTTMTTGQELVPVPVNENGNGPSNGFIKAIFTPGIPVGQTRMIWEVATVDRRKMLENFVQVIMQ